MYSSQRSTSDRCRCLSSCVADDRRPIRRVPVRPRRGAVSRRRTRACRGGVARAAQVDREARRVRDQQLRPNARFGWRSACVRSACKPTPTRWRHRHWPRPACSRGRGVGRAFVIGEAGIVEALGAGGIEVPTASRNASTQSWWAGTGVPTTRSSARRRCSSSAEPTLVATNPDASFPAEDGTRWPGAGALLAAIETTTGVRGEVIGKPHAPSCSGGPRACGGRQAAGVGDRLDTDIAGAVGARLGFDARAHRHRTGARVSQASPARPRT